MIKSNIEKELSVSTYFASTERQSEEEIARHCEELSEKTMLMTAFDAVPVTLLVLNAQRQVIGVNSLTRDQFGEAFSQVFGKRPGEVFGCVHASNAPNGCGTARACASCGAVKAILECIDLGERTSHECSLQTVGKDGNVQCLDLKVTVSRFQVDGKYYYSLILEDNAQTKRLEVFQRLFFHDILNTIGCIKGYVEVIQYTAPPAPAQKEHIVGEESYLLQHLARLCEQLNSEVVAHRELLSAENGELTVNREDVRTTDVLHALLTHYQNHEIGQGHVLMILPSCDKKVQTDRLLLMRIMGNMLKNAIEASPIGSRVTLQCLEEDEQVVFLVNNPGVIPHDVQYQIFKRSFSTKSEAGHGIGTYSMKLFGEKYLNGQIDFTSDPKTGTTFRFRVPVAVQ